MVSVAIQRRVLDLSHHNTVSNLQTVKDAGIWGIIHKATEGTSYIDDKYAGRKAGFLELGLLWGAYHFVHPGYVEQQVDFFLSVAGVDDQTLYAFDWEESSSGTMNEDQAEQFMRLLEQKTGRKAVVYSGNAAKEQIYGTNSYLGSCRLWLAQYSSNISWQQSWDDVWLHQYSDGQNGPGPHGCPGVTGDVDTNSWLNSEEQLRAEWSGTGAAPPVGVRNRIVISSGHGLYVRGMRGDPVPPQLDEVDENRRTVDRVADYLAQAGVDVTTFHDNTSHDQQTNLETIVAFHNSQGPHDLDVSVHFNCCDSDGTECLYITQQDLSAQVSAAISAASGIRDRGPVLRNDLYFLRHTIEPAILIEVCYGDNTNDSNLYNQNFEAICKAIADTISGETGEIAAEDRPTISKGDEGVDVKDMQVMLNDTELKPGLSTDGDFGSLTEAAVIAYQGSRGLAADGICGQQTWGALYDQAPPLPPPSYGLSAAEQDAICQIASASSIASYSWADRGQAPIGYTMGMALAFAQSYKKLQQGHPAAVDMAKRRQSSDKDALNIYAAEFSALDMSNETAGNETLRHLYALMLGHGMRESSGRHCEGRDMSASNVQSDTAEAGLFQTSYNAHSASDPEFDNLMTEYSNPSNSSTCYLSTFDDDVSCSDSDWSCYGSGSGYAFQKLCKSCPAFAVETCGLTLRNLANHYGPIIRKETELKSAADDMFRQVQDYIDQNEPSA